MKIPIYSSEQEDIARCPCCKGFFPRPKNWGWAGRLACKECETSLAIDPAYPYLHTCQICGSHAECLCQLGTEALKDLATQQRIDTINREERLKFRSAFRGKGE